jgi:NadR type nicotinamide-nucleotide adenylyltransferase
MASIIPESADDGHARSDRLTRIVVTGSESTGKTQLAEQLAAHYGVPWVPEFARDFAQQKSGMLSVADVTPIARGQIARENDALLDASGMIVLDTDLVSTVVYSEQYYGGVPAWITLAAKERLADLYLVCDIDLPWVADTVRNAQHRRRKMHDAFAEHLTRFGATYHVVSGTGPERLSRAIGYIDSRHPHPLP